jgi:hypothetical protein
MIAKGKKTEIPGANSTGKNWGRGISVVTLRGKTNHVGIDITQTPRNTSTRSIIVLH